MDAKLIRGIYKCKCGKIWAYEYSTDRHRYIAAGIAESVIERYRVAGKKMLPYQVKNFEYIKSLSPEKVTPLYYEFDMLCECGKLSYPTWVHGKFNAEKVCNARCMGATSGVCECQCGGRNHGGKHDVR